MKEDGQRNMELVGYWHSQNGAENACSVGEQPDPKPTQRHKNFPVEATIAAREEVTPEEAEGDVQAGFIAQSLENTCFWEEKYSPRKQQHSGWERQQERLDGRRNLT